MSKTTTNQTIEVLALLGDSLVDVKHVAANASTGKPSTATKTLLAIGAGALVASAAAFGMAVTTAATNKANLDTWTRALKPAHAFRAQQSSVAVDVTAAAGGALGLLGVTLGLARLRREKQARLAYRIGTGPNVELPLEHAPAAEFPLVEQRGDVFVMSVPAEMTGVMTDADGQTSALVPNTTVPIPADAKIRAKLGTTLFVVSSVAKPATQLDPMFDVDPRALKYGAGSLAAHIAAVAFLAMVPVEATATGFETTTMEAIAMTSSTTANDDALVQRAPTDDGQAGGGGGSTMALDGQGVTGSKSATSATGENQIARPASEIEIARQEAREAARERNPWGSHSVQVAIENMTGDFDVASYVNDVTTRGDGGEGDGAGDDDFGGRSNRLGRCPAGQKCGVAGTGPYGTIKDGKKAGDEYKPGNGHGDDRVHRAELPVVPGPPKVAGGGDKEIIRRYVNRYREQIGACYERELMANHSLGNGELQVTFVISPDGSVATATSQGFDSKVGSCVSSTVKTIAFPRMGEGVQVNYPFTFHKVG